MFNLIFGDKPSKLINQLTDLVRSNNTNLNQAVEDFLSQNKNLITKDELSQTLLYVAQLGKKHDVIKPLIEYKADPNYKGTFDNTALHLTTANGYAKTCLTLLKFNANPHSFNTLGSNPADAALSWFKKYPNQVMHDKKTKSILLCIELNSKAQKLDLGDLKNQLSLTEWFDQQIKIAGEESES